MGSARSIGGFSGNAVMKVAQRSNGATVKSVISDLRRKCLESNKQSDAGREPPLEECVMLAQWASVDVYYKVVITKYNGVEVVVAAMKAYPLCEDLQTFCCAILQNLNNKIQVKELGGTIAILEAMKNHSSSVAVQVEACMALKEQNLVLQQESHEFMTELQQLLAHAHEMYLTPSAQSAIEFLNELVSSSISTVQKDSFCAEQQRPESAGFLITT